VISGSGTPLAKRLLRRAGQAFAFLLFCLLGLPGVIARLARRPSPVGQVRRILIIRLDLLGDMVMSLPAVDAMKDAFPEAQVTVLALPYAAGLLELAPRVDRVLSFDVNLVRRPRELLRRGNWRHFRDLIHELRSADFDVCLSLHGKFACVLAWLSGCSRRYGYRAEAYPGLLTHTIPGGRYRVRQHEVLYNLKLAEVAGGSVDWNKPRAPRLQVPQSEQRRMRHLLGEFEIRADTLLVVIHPGAANGSAKRWPAESWARLAGRLKHDLGAIVVLSGTASDAAVVEDVARACSFRPLIMAGQTSIPQFGALIKRADLLLSSDSGPAHMAAALGTPQVTLFGPTDPAVYAPSGGKALILRRQLACSPCYNASASAECRFGHVNCMREIDPDEVYNASVRQLQRRLQSGGVHR